MLPSKNLPMERNGKAGATIHKKILACPARFERATYVLEEFTATGISNNFNDLHHKNGAV
jgi:hypothetical protein